MNKSFECLPYDPTKLPRELKKYYISAGPEEVREMLSTVGASTLDELFDHIPDNIKFSKKINLPAEKSYSELLEHMQELAQKNHIKSSFIGDGLQSYKVPNVIGPISDIRGLTTAYTPYQPERSQGTLQTLWIYSSTMSMLTGFEAINASFYDRSTSLFEAINTSLRIVKKSDTAIVCQSIYPGDIEVLKTLAKETNLNLIFAPIDAETGLTNLEKLKEIIEEYSDRLASISFPQINCFGNLENTDLLTDLCWEKNIQSIAIFDPMLLANTGLKPPAKYGSSEQGCHMIVGEGQHLAIAPNFGGPGLGIFGIRFNADNKTAIRATAGRYVGKGMDANGKTAWAMVLSTREQHIRREKASSNICSNQGFLASLAGAAILSRGEDGLNKSCSKAFENALRAMTLMTSYAGIKLAFKESFFFNEFTLELKSCCNTFIKNAAKASVHIGVDVSKRIDADRELLLVSCSDLQTKDDFDKLETFLNSNFSKSNDDCIAAEIPKNYLRKNPVGLSKFSDDEIIDFYKKLGEQNVSPDDNIYPLGSCTMKYNPYINDYAANLEGFTNIHPQAPIEDAQGSLEVLFNIQEMFQAITGLPALTTQPVAGAQGELAGLKMFQAYHRDRGNGETKNVILIPRSAHGTNPATATMAGYESKIVNGEKIGIVTIQAYENGQINFEELEDAVKIYGNRISSIMITNPNTSGIFENRFKEISDLIHSVDGLVYMDGANLNAISGIIDLDAMGVDAVHSNLHKTWTISHGGGGPGDAIVAVSNKLVDYLPGVQVIRKNGLYQLETSKKSIGSFHRHFGNFAHKIRCYAYISALGAEGVKAMSSIAVLSARYLFEKVKKSYPTLPANCEDQKRMHEFILTISGDDFDKLAKVGIMKPMAIAKIGKIFLDFGMHAPTVAFPEQFGLMVEPTESFSKSELERFLQILESIRSIISEKPHLLLTAPHFTPVGKVDEVAANKKLNLFESYKVLPEVLPNIIEPAKLNSMNVEDIVLEIEKAHKQSSCTTL